MSFDISKFLGDWYEMCTNATSAKGQCLNLKSTISGFKDQYKITNHCYKGGSKVQSSTGDLKQGSESPSKMKLSTGFFKRDANYWVHDTDYKSYAIVGNGDKTFWIMYREPYIPVCVCHKLIAKAKELGYDSSAIVYDNDVLIQCN